MKRILYVCMAVALMFTFAYGAEKQNVKKQEDKKSWWQKLKNKVEKITPGRGGTTTTAVGGVRGAKDDDANSLYWKGKDGSSLSQDELDMFNSAIDLATKGKDDDAVRMFDKFLVSYPNSSLAEDARQSITTIRASR